MCEVLTVQDVATMLQMSKRQVFMLCRAAVRETQQFPIPRIVIHGQLRFVRSLVEEWISKLSSEEAQ
jgi:predicted DNA-binding transcriptional regulator AlpA